jgi:hypothetical protein
MRIVKSLEELYDVKVERKVSSAKQTQLEISRLSV